MAKQKLTGADAKIGGASLSGALTLKAKRIPITTKTAAEIDTGWDLPAKAVVLDIVLDVKTAEATASTKALDVGLLSSETGGDADGFLVQVSTSSAVMRRGILTGAVISRGALLRDAGSASVFSAANFLSDSVVAKSVTYTPAAAHTELTGDIVIFYSVLRP